jgi:shikimate kinase / 3-dehydroquinate synthase
MSHIYLYGPPGSGKSTIGRILAERLGMPFADIDTLIEREAGCKIADIFAARGEPAFRDMESAAIEDTAAREPSVIALGGGALLRPQNRSFAEEHGCVLCFTAESRTLLERVRKAPGQRPLANETGATPEAESPLLKLLQARAEHYGSFALTLKVSDIPPEQTASNAQCVLGRYRVSGMGGAYDVYAGGGLLARTGALLRERALGERCVIVADTNTAPLYASAVAESLAHCGIASSVAVIPAGEEHKTIDTVGLLWKKFMEAGIERRDCVIALGGGVTGDLAGFAAATWLRGVRWISMPTTLLAMCDSGLGGKTGADLPEGKNLVGAFHPPALVITDTDTLFTLPVRELRCGLAESVKHAVIDDPALIGVLPRFDFCRSAADKEPCAVLRSAEWLCAFVCRSMAVKIRVITEDPYETGIRASLNLGHTIGHGLEKATHFTMQHGEAVAAGIVLEARLAAAMNLAPAALPDQLAAHLASLGLPVSVPEGTDIDAVMAAMALDKKRAGGKVRFALPAAVGKVLTGIVVEEDLIRSTLKTPEPRTISEPRLRA